MIIFQAGLPCQQKVLLKAIRRYLTLIPDGYTMFSTEDDADNRALFRAEYADNPNLLGLAE